MLATPHKIKNTVSCWTQQSLIALVLKLVGNCFDDFILTSYSLCLGSVCITNHEMVCNSLNFFCLHNLSSLVHSSVSFSWWECWCQRLPWTCSMLPWATQPFDQLPIKTMQCLPAKPYHTFHTSTSCDQVNQTVIFPVKKLQGKSKDFHKF